MNWIGLSLCVWQRLSGWIWRGGAYYRNLSSHLSLPLIRIFCWSVTYTEIPMLWSLSQCLGGDQGDHDCRGANGKSRDLETEDSLDRVFVRKYFDQNLAFKRGLSIAGGHIVTQNSRRKVETHHMYHYLWPIPLAPWTQPTSLPPNQHRIRHLRYTKGDQEWQIGRSFDDRQCTPLLESSLG